MTKIKNAIAMSRIIADGMCCGFAFGARMLAAAIAHKMKGGGSDDDLFDRFTAAAAKSRIFANPSI